MPTLFMIPANLDIEAWQGDPLGLEVTVTDDAGDVLPLTGYTGAMQVRQEVADLAPFVDATATVTITDAANGVLEAVIDRATMASLAGRYRYDLQIVDSSGQPQTVLEGAFIVRQEVTR